jgi:hypothetical protein
MGTVTINQPPESRLERGAAALGKLWKAGDVRCGWSGVCLCEERTKFCGGKELWVRLAREEGRKVGASDYAIIEAMTDDELKASTLTVVFEIPEVGKVGIGGENGQVDFDFVLALHEKDREGARRVLATLAAFPGSKVDGEEKVL